MPQTLLERQADEMKRVVRHLTPYSFPKGNIEDETDLLPLKNRAIVVDGYDVSLTLSESDFDSYMVESLQIQGVYTPFLPFYVVCKVARAFLGEAGLSHADFVKNNRKIYCWTARRKGGKTLKPKAPQLKYEGFTYSMLKPGQLNLYGSKD